MPQRGRHLKALLKKNIILTKRNLTCSILEIFLPVLMVCFMILFRALVKASNVADKSYVNEKNIFYPDANSLNYETVGGQTVEPILQNCKTRRDSSNEYPSYRNGDVIIISNNVQMATDLEALFTTMTYTTRSYTSEAALFSYIKSEDYDYDVCLGVEIIEDLVNLKWTYKLLYNITRTDDYKETDLPYTKWEEQITYEYERIDENYNTWLSSGFVTIQTWLDNLILKQQAASTAYIKVKSSSVKVEGHKQDDLLDGMQGMFAPFIVLPLLIIYLRMTYGLLIEKEKKIREGMKIMGMSNFSFYLSWIIHYIIVYTITSVLVTIVLKCTVFPKSSFGIVFITHWIFSMTLLFQSLFITVFFTRAKMGNLVGMVFYLLQYFGNFAIQDSTTSYEKRRSASFCSQTGMSFACDVFLLIEASQKGINIENIKKKINNIDISTIISMFIANIIVFFLLFIYLDQVFPNEFGKKKHPFFFIKCFFDQCKKKPQINQEQQEVQKQNGQGDVESHPALIENMEEVDMMLKQKDKNNQVIKLSNLRKTYSTGKVAVKDLNLTMYKDQIFALLGHNGAGKTTTISMLTGMLSITSGSGKVMGLDINENLDKLRTMMGVCPQHDILFDMLTVKEHLELFAVFKGMEPKEIPTAVEEAIKGVNLQKKKNDLAKNLSGGQRRRLSVAIAFIGGSKIIYLDEPTSGMDTSARRHIWDILKKYKQNKIVVLTTHFMDEADYLGDRIGIMGEGKLLCCGSSIYLKNKFGIGYTLTIVKTDTQTNSQPIINKVQEHIASVKVVSDVSAEVQFQLPLEQVTKFEPLFLDLDNHKPELSIQSYGISITTMEEVFLKVADMTIEAGDQQEQKDQLKQQLSQIKENPEIDNFDLSSVNVGSNFKKFNIHFWALVKKRLLYFKRDRRGLICEVLLPGLISVIGLAISLKKFLNDLAGYTIQPSLFDTPNPVIYSEDSSVTHSKVATLMGYLNSNYWTKEYYAATTQTDFDDYNYQKRMPDRLGDYWFDLVDDTNDYYQYYTQVNTLNKDAFPYLVNQMNKAILNQALSSTTAQLNVVVQPFPLTSKQKKISDFLNGMVSSFIFSIANAFIPASIIVIIVKEKEDQVKHQQLVSGVSISSYWTSNFFLDIIKHLIPATFCSLMTFAFNISIFIDNGAFGAVALLFYLYGWAIIPFTYLMGFMFKKYGNAQVSAFFLHYLVGTILPLVTYILRFFDSTRTIGHVLQWIFRFIPSYCFSYGILSISSIKILSVLDNKDGLYSPYDVYIAGGDIAFLAWTGPFYFALIFLIEYQRFSRFMTRMFSVEKSVPPKESEVFDEDVLKEIAQIEANTNPKEYSIKVDKLRKVFVLEKNRTLVAVDQISFGIKNGECFTLLGVNGAGKTTTFKMLSGEITQTSGTVHIAGYNIETDLPNARRFIGYCPQFDALLENLTVKEHLELYSQLKLIPKNMIGKLVDRKMVEMDLQKYSNVCAGNLSGGNKRKLSVGIAMIGNPPIVFMDEPSTGMDPKARRFMWTVISRISTKRKQSSIILTTHSMEEAEALSTRIAIMVEGSIKCLGSIQQIKSKYGTGYEVELKTHLPTQEQLNAEIKKLSMSPGQFCTKELVNQVFTQMKVPQLIEQVTEEGFGSSIWIEVTQNGGLHIENIIEFVLIEKMGEYVFKFLQDSLKEIILIEHFQNFYRYKINTMELSIGKLFGLFEKNKSTLCVQNYSVKQSTIEQIFNNFAINKVIYKNQVAKNIINTKPNNIVPNNIVSNNIVPSSTANQNQQANSNNNMNDDQSKGSNSQPIELVKINILENQSNGKPNQ